MAGRWCAKLCALQVRHHAQHYLPGASRFWLSDCRTAVADRLAWPGSKTGCWWWCPRRHAIACRAPPRGAAGAAGGSDAGQLREQQLLSARRGLQDWIGHALGSAQLASGAGGGSMSDAGSVAGASGISSDSGSGGGRADAGPAGGGVPGIEAGTFDADALEGGALAPLATAAALLEELLPAAAPALVGGSAAGVRNASRIYAQACQPSVDTCTRQKQQQRARVNAAAAAAAFCGDVIPASSTFTIAEPDFGRQSAACLLPSQVAEAVPGAVQRHSAALEGLAVRHCRLLLAECLAGSLASAPRLARSHVQQVAA